MSKKILTSGVDSEYVLSDLCNYLKNQKYDVIELDFGLEKRDPIPLLQSLKNDDVFYITSAHTNLTKDTAEFIVPSFNSMYPNYISPLEIMGMINPKCSIYIPHDLLTPYGPTLLNEYRFLGLFDYILAPYDTDILRKILPKSTRVINAGWIKYNNKTILNKNNNGRIQIFLTMIDYLRQSMGISGIIEYLRPICRNDWYIKLPKWHGVEKIEKQLKVEKIIQVIPSNVNSTELILESDVVIANGASSIHIESSMLGRPTICLQDDQGISSDEQHEMLKGHADNIYFHGYHNKTPITDSTISKLKDNKGKNKLSPFQFDQITSIIEEENVAQYC